jgi:predicted dehydrogenase
MLLEYPEGVYANLDASFVKQSELNAFIFGDDAYIKILPKWLEDTAGLEIREYGKEGHAEKIDVSWEGHGFQFEIDEVVRCLREGKRESEVHPHQASLDLVEIMDDVRRQTGIRYPSDEEAGA